RAGNHHLRAGGVERGVEARYPRAQLRSLVNSRQGDALAQQELGEVPHHVADLGEGALDLARLGAEVDELLVQLAGLVAKTEREIRQRQRLWIARGLLRELLVLVQRVLDCRHYCLSSSMRSYL